MQIKVLSASEGMPVTEFVPSGGFIRRVIHPSTVGSKYLNVAMLILKPGEHHVRHVHTFEEGIIPISGEGEMQGEAEGSWIKLEKLDWKQLKFVYIPPNVPHGPYRNTGSEDLVVIAVGAPAPSGMHEYKILSK